MRGVFTFAFAAFLASASALADGWVSMREGIQTLVQSKDSEVSLRPDGTLLVERAFNPDGSLRRFVVRDLAANPHRVETLERLENPLRRVFTVQLGEAIFSEETTYLNLRTEIPIQAVKVMRGLKVVTDWQGAERIVRRFRPAKDGSWVLEREDRYHRTAAEAQKVIQKGVDQYIQCLKAQRPGLNETECRRQLTDLVQAVRQTTQFENYASVECNDGQSLHLPNGYRVNLKTCTTPEAVNSIKRATNRVVEEHVGCLADINPNAATNFVKAIQELRPEIQCGGRPEAREAVLQRSCGNNAACRTGLKADYASANAGMGGEGEPLFHLDKGDPMINEKYRNDPSTINRDTLTAPTLDQRFTLRKTVYREVSFSGLIFHETMHNAKFKCPAGHDHSVRNLNDPVYACMTLCSSNQKAVSKESCLTCARAEGNSPSAEVLAACERHFPPFSAIEAFSAAIMILKGQTACQGGDTASCTSLAANPTVISVCGTSGPRTQECHDKLVADQRAKVAAIRAAPGGENSWGLWRTDVEAVIPP